MQARIISRARWYGTGFLSVSWDEWIVEQQRPVCNTHHQRQNGHHYFNMQQIRIGT